MRIRLSKYCGFCFGVKRALRMIEKTLDEKNEPVYSLGPFIHNPQVVKQFLQKGLKITSSLKNIKAKTLIVRTHGIPSHLIKKARLRGIKLLDVTCPNVKRAQEIARHLAAGHYKIIIVGDKTHPEVKSLVSAGAGCASVVDRPQAVEKMRLKAAKVGVIAQTTQSKSSYLKVLALLLEKDFSELKIYNTICNDVLRRQKEAYELARDVALMLVLGGKMSANSRRLAQICRATGTPTYHIESGSQLKPQWLRAKRSVGIVSGASTPRWIVAETVNLLKKER